MRAVLGFISVGLIASADPVERKLFEKLFKADQEVTEHVAKRQKILDQVTAYCKSKDMLPGIQAGQIQAQCNAPPKPAPVPVPPPPPPPPTPED